MTELALPPHAARRAPYPPPRLTRWGITWRYVCAAVICAYMFISITANFAIVSHRMPGVPAAVPFILIGGDLAGLIVAAVLVRYRRRWPVGICWAMVALSLISPSSSGFACWAYISLCTRLRWKEIIGPALTWLIGGAAWSVLLLSVLGFGRGLDGMSQLVVISLMGLASLAGTAVYTAIGIGIGSQRRDVAVAQERAEQAEREQALRVAQGQAAERARIAREMHDVVAHRISLVAMHAGALAYRTDLEPDRMREVARGIQENSTAALTELRGVLAELREDAQPSGPQPSLADVGPLLAGFRDGGMRIDVTGEVSDLDTMAPAQSRHAYRIVQEALTNARKHAVNAPVHLHASGSPEAGLSIEVRNPKTYTSSVPGGGLGLVGLAERAELAGGKMWSGTDKGDFVVKAWLPWAK